MKLFTNSDVEPHGCVAGAGRIMADRSEMVHAPLPWQKDGPA